MSPRALALAGTAIRAAYGIGGLAAPDPMARTRFTPNTEERPDARLYVRGFSGHQLLVAGYTVAARGRDQLRAALWMNVAIDAMDVAAAVVELRGRGEGADQRDTVGGIAFSALGLVTFAGVLARY